MTIRTTNIRGIMRSAAIAGMLFASVMLLLAAEGMAPLVPLLDTPGVDAAAAAGTLPVGPLTFSPASGNSDQQFAIAPTPRPPTCPGDSANDGFAVNSFMTPVTNDPAVLTYNAAGPIGTGFTQPLFDRFGTPILAKNTAPDTGLVLSVGPIKFDVFEPGLVPAGQYFIGIACTKAGATESFWASTIAVTDDAVNGGTSGLQVALVAGTSPTTTTTTTTTVAGATTTTSTTIAGATTTTVAGATTTSTTVAGATTTTVAGATTTTVAGGSTNATVTPASPTPGGSYRVAFPNCTVGETVTFRQPESTPATATGVCQASSALTSGSVAGFRMPAQATAGTATGSFTAAPSAAGSYTVTMTGTASAQRTTTFVIVAPSTPVTGGNPLPNTGGNPSANTGGSPTGSSTGTIPSTGSSTTSLIVWGLLLLVFGRMAILLGRKPKVLTGIR